MTVNHQHWSESQWQEPVGGVAPSTEALPFDQASVTAPAVNPDGMTELPAEGEVQGGVFQSIIGGINGVFQNIFGRKYNPALPVIPIPPILNEFQTGLEAHVQPMFSRIDSSLSENAQLRGETENAIASLKDAINPEIVNSNMWEMQVYTDELFNQRLTNNEDAIATLKKAFEASIRQTTRTIFIDRRQSTYDDYVQVDQDGLSQWKITARNHSQYGPWVGFIIFQGVYKRGEEFEPTIDGWKVTASDRVKYLPTHNSNPSVLTYSVHPGRGANFQKTTTASAEAVSGAWVPISELTWTAEQTSEHVISFNAGWHAATNDNVYGIRVRRNGVETLGQVTPRSDVGPTFPWGNGYSVQYVLEYGKMLAKNDVVTFEIYTNATGVDQRTIRDAKIDLSWIEPAVDDLGSTAT